MTFLDQAVADTQAFLDLFGAPHQVDSQTIQAMVDRRKAVTDSGGYRSSQEGVYAEITTLRVATAAVAEPAVGQVMTLDGREYLVSGVGDEHGLLAIDLVRNDS